MKTTGTYCAVTNKFDLDHEINAEVERLKKIIKNIDSEHTKENAKAIKKALAETLIEAI